MLRYVTVAERNKMKLQETGPNESNAAVRFAKVACVRHLDNAE